MNIGTAYSAGSAVDLQHAVDAVKATFTLAAGRGGATQARIALAPAALGGIRISLTQTANGLVARIVADHPEAARTLLQSGGELRASLESSGLPLLSLDIEAHGDPGAAAGNAGQAADRGGSFAGHPTPNSPDEDVETDPTPAALAPADGTLVDVLA